MAQPEGGEELRQRLALRLRRLTGEVEHLGHQFAALHAMHPTDMRALVVLLDAERDGRTMTPGRLGAELNLTSASMTALVDRLERSGHVQRVRDPGDRRRVSLQVQPKVHEVGQALFGGLNRELIEAMAGFDEAELNAIDRFLAAMTGVVVANRQARGTPSRP
jgi:DNA-binding MarR family transcriptional regulator